MGVPKGVREREREERKGRSRLLTCDAYLVNLLEIQGVTFELTVKTKTDIIPDLI